MNKPLKVTETYTANPQQVWQAITDKKQMKSWYFDIPDFDLKEGAVFNFYEPGDEKKFHHLCKILAIVPERKLQHTWAYPNQSKGTSILTWEIIPDGNQTKVILTHEGTENFADGGADLKREKFLAGWTENLEKSLKQFLESNFKGSKED